MIGVQDGIERKIAWMTRDKKSYCFNHPKIHPENDEQIRWVEGSTCRTDKDGNKYDVEEFVYCPKCLITISKQNYEKI